MVYDPIRDCEVPSPATSQTSPWGNYDTPGSRFSAGPEDAKLSTGGRLQPPAFNGGPFSPTGGGSQRSSQGGLRGLLNEEAGDALSRRSSGRTNSVSSLHDEEPPTRQSISRLLNEGSAPLLAKTNSSSSVHNSSPTHPSPGPRQTFLDPNVFPHLSTPSARSRSDTSRSPYPQHAISPATVVQPLPCADNYGHPGQYVEHHAGPSRRRPSESGQKPMMPPQDHHSRHDLEHHPRMTPPVHHLPLRSPSVSVSPRGQYQNLPHATVSSRPSSSISNQSHPFSFQAPSLHTPAYSPHADNRRLSETFSQPSRPASSSSNGRRATIPEYTGQVDLSYSPQLPKARPIRSPSPIRSAMYDPNRISAPSSVLDPIYPDDIARLRSMGQTNNPLRKRKRPLPSWSAPSPGHRAQPSENDTSYFQESSRPPSSTVERRSQTPGTHQEERSHTPAASSRRPPPARNISGNGSVDSGTAHGNVRKRKSEHFDGEGQDSSRRKVSDGQYVGNVAAVANHYNSRPEVGVKGRELSPIIGLKKFNNWIKSVLIGKFAHRARGGGEGAKVLDIGCGKGGDLNKWKQARIRLYVALDLAEESVKQARGRYEAMNNPSFEAHFYDHDCFTKPVGEALPESLRQRDLYDNVTMQFCMHYAFESASKARMMIENVAKYLRKGGIFLGTIPDSDLLLKRLEDIPEEDPDLRFGNSCYYVQFDERRHKGIYGHAYRFFLQDAVEDVPEYIVNWDNFVALAAEYKLRLVYRKPFNDVLQEEKDSRDFGPLLGKMGVINRDGESAMDADQWEAANLYMAFAFEKY